MKAAKKIVSIALLLLAVTVAFTGCQFFSSLINGLTSVNGTVVDGRSASLSGLGTVAVMLTSKDDSSIVLSATTDSSGSYTIDYDKSGAYKLTASKDGWFFIPQTVYLGGLVQSLPQVIGIELETSAKLQDTSLSFVLVWNSTYQDVDGHLTFPDGDGIGDGLEGIHTPVNLSTFTSPNQAWSPAGGGFGPDTATATTTTAVSGREWIRPLGTTPSESLNTVGEVLGISDTRPAVQLDRDDRNGSGPEVISVRSLPFWPSTYQNSIYNITGNGTDNGNYLPTTYDWAWIGVMEYYIDGWNKTSSTGDRPPTDNLISSTDGSGADAILYVIQGSSLLGEFIVPSFANIRTASIVRVNLFVGDNGTDYASYFQIVPDIEVVDGRSSIKSAGEVTGTGIVGAFGAGR